MGPDIQTESGAPQGKPCALANPTLELGLQSQRDFRRECQHLFYKGTEQTAPPAPAHLDAVCGDGADGPLVTAVC